MHPFEFNPGVIFLTNESHHIPASRAEPEGPQDKDMGCANILLSSSPIFPGGHEFVSWMATSQAAMKAQECFSSFPIRGDRCFPKPPKTNGTSCSNLRAPSLTPRSTKVTQNYGCPLVYNRLSMALSILTMNFHCFSLKMGLTRVMSFHACISATKRHILN
jgi:hypothetical protein